MGRLWPVVHPPVKPARVTGEQQRQSFCSGNADCVSQTGISKCKLTEPECRHALAKRNTSVMFQTVQSLPNLEIYTSRHHGRPFAGMRDGFTTRRYDSQHL